MKVPSALFVAASLVAIDAGCGSSERSFDPTKIDPNGPGGTPFVGNTGPGSSNTNSANTGPYTPPTELGCSSRAQEILIVDFRSGWWAGGGGGGFTDTALKAVVGACALTSVDYHHFETSMHLKCTYRNDAGGPSGKCNDLGAATSVDAIRNSFDKKSVAEYTQIWVLSGSDQDDSDIKVGDALFQGVLGDTKGACTPMLVGAGDGFMTHANTIAQDFGMGSVFVQKTNPPSFFSVSIGGPAASTSSLGTGKLTGHLLFKNLPSIADNVKNPMMQQAHGDSLVEQVSGEHVYQVVAHDTEGNPSIAVGAAKVGGDGYRPFIFDAGWQRMYMLDKDPGTAQYLKNIVMWMGLVGCKAAPIGPPR